MGDGSSDSGGYRTERRALTAQLADLANTVCCSGTSINAPFSSTFHLKGTVPPRNEIDALILKGLTQPVVAFNVPVADGDAAGVPSRRACSRAPRRRHAQSKWQNTTNPAESQGAVNGGFGA